MNSVTVTWSLAPLSELLDTPDGYFYAFGRGSNLLYIGLAYRQTVQAEIMQSLERLEIDTRGLRIWVGYITESTYGNIREQLVEDVEALLIYVNQPSENVQNKENYNGRTNFEVLSYECPLVEGGQV